MGNIRETQYFQAVQDKKMEVSDVLEQVYIALTEKGYNPVNQIVGYIMSGDPTYITSHKGARSLIMKVERDEILEELMAVYIDARLNNSAGQTAAAGGYRQHFAASDKIPSGDWERSLCLMTVQYNTGI